MFDIANDVLRARMLDPVADRDRLGPRYCWGGYPYQLFDAQGRVLLSGPQYPLDPPMPFHGQGLPESFRLKGAKAEGLLNINAEGQGLFIGVGVVSGFDGEEPILGKACEWSQEIRGDRVSMSTAQSHAGWGYALTRTIVLDEGTVRSFSEVTSTGENPLDVHWFCHPFFPLVDGGMTFSVRPPVEMADNPGYTLRDDGRIAMKASHDWTKGRFEWLPGAYDAVLEVTLEHPVVGHVTMRGDFPVTYMAVWANENTISWEPHTLHRLHNGQSVSWNLSFTFGD